MGWVQGSRRTLGYVGQILARRGAKSWRTGSGFLKREVLRSLENPEERKEFAALKSV